MITGHPGHRGLLHHLDRDPAGQHHRARAPGPAPARASAPISLSSALWRPDILARQHDAPPPGTRTPRHGPRGSRSCSGWCAAQRLGAPAISCARQDQRRQRTTRQVAHRLVQPVDPAQPAAHRPRHLRRRVPRALRPAPSASQIRASIPCGRARRSRSSRSRPAPRSTPSVSAKPWAKSSRSAGVAIITACVVPLKTSATGTSSGSARVTARAPSRPTARPGRLRHRRAPAHSAAGRIAARLRGLRGVVLLPVGRPVRRRHLHRRHLVFRAVRRPVGIVGGDHVGLRVGVVEGGVDHAGRHAVGDRRRAAPSRPSG